MNVKICEFFILFKGYYLYRKPISRRNSKNQLIYILNENKIIDKKFSEAPNTAQYIREDREKYGEDIDDTYRIYNYTTDEKSAVESRKIMAFNNYLVDIFNKVNWK